jgi:hypothetical protein
MEAMRTVLARAVVLLALALAGCAAPQPPFGATALPPLPAGQARLFFYRALEPYETAEVARIQLNGQPAGASQRGAVFFRDVAPGRYAITIIGTEPYPNQFKTVVLRPGESAYVRIDSLSAWTTCTIPPNCYPVFVVTLVAPAQAQAEMRALSFSQG